MGRSVLVGFGAVVISWVLLCIFVILWMSWTRSGDFARDPSVVNQDYTTVNKEYGDPFRFLQTAKSGYDLLVIPAISILTGVFVGLVGRTRTGWISTVAILPLQVFWLTIDGFSTTGFVRVLVYSLLAFFCAEGTAHFSDRGKLTSGSPSV